MATDYLWRGTSNDFSVATNFDPVGNPADGDTVTVGLGGAWITSGLDQSDVELERFERLEGSRVKIATASSPLQIAAANFHIAGAAECHLKHHGAASVRYVITMDTRPELCTIDGTGASGLRIVARRGTIHVAETCQDITKLFVTSIDFLPDSTSLVMLGSNDIGSARMNNGIVLCERRHDNGDRISVNIDGGIWRQDGTQYTGYNISAGTVVHTSTGLVNGVVMSGGLIDFTQGQQPMSVTLMTLLPGSDYNDSPLVTHTNPIRDYRERLLFESN